MPHQSLLLKLYDAFNRRDLETALAFLHPDVQWENGQYGGVLTGRDAVRDYWQKQLTVIAPHIEPVTFEDLDDNMCLATVFQVIRDPDGNPLYERMIGQRFTFQDNRITRLAILGPDA